MNENFSVTFFFHFLFQNLMADNHFEWLDYIIFGFPLSLSAAIGFYFAFVAKKKQNTRLEYLLGSKTMGVFPISMSLIAR